MYKKYIDIFLNSHMVLYRDIHLHKETFAHKGLGLYRGILIVHEEIFLSLNV